MFTLKFIKDDKFVVVCGQRYEFYPFDNRISWTEDGSGIAGGIVTVYDSKTTESGGVQFNVTNIGSKMEGSETFDLAFVTNQAGKTIGRIGPFGVSPEQIIKA